MTRKFQLIFLGFITIFYACNKQENIPITIVDTNIKKEVYNFDFNKAYQHGFKVPSINLDSIDAFELTFEIPGELS